MILSRGNVGSPCRYSRLVDEAFWQHWFAFAIETELGLIEGELLLLFSGIPAKGMLPCPTMKDNGMYSKKSFTVFVTGLRSNFERVQWNGVQQRYVDFMTSTK